jgi:MoaA/NifB/PqqE/SkfB family radical SAM enzyme
MCAKMDKKVLSIPSSHVSHLIQIGNKSIMDNSYLGMPFFVQIEITSKCNLVCKYCQRTSDLDNQNNVDMTLDSFNMIINQLRHPTRSVHLVGMGEPLLNPDVFSMIKSAKKKGLEVSLIDNFTLIDREKSLALIESGLDFLYISFDSTIKDTFEELRTGANFEKIIENVKLFVKTKTEVKAKRPVFLFKSTISSFNMNEIPQLVKLAEDLGADGINFGKMMSAEETNSRISTIRLSEKDLPSSKIHVYPCELSDSYQCDALRGCYVTYDLKVLPCGLIPESTYRALYSQFTLGDLSVDSLGNIWRHSFKKFRKKIKSGNYLPRCRTCAGYKGAPPAV